MRFLILLFLNIYLFASNTIEISQSKYFIDETKKLSLEEIQTKDFIENNLNNFGFRKTPIWSKITIRNTFFEDKELYAINYRSSLDYIDIYIVHENGKIDSFLIGDRRDITNRVLLTRLPHFPIKMKANEKIDIYIKHSNERGIVETKWEFKDFKYLNNLIYKDTLFFGFYMGIVSLLIIVGLITYFALKKRFLLYYSIVAFSILIGQLMLNGFLHSLDFGISYSFLNHPEIFFYLTSLFIILFHYDFFDIQYERKELRLFIKFLMLIPLSFILIDLLLPSSYCEKYIPLSVVLHWFVTISLIITGIRMSIKGIKGGWFYVLGQCLSFLSVIFVTIYIVYSAKAAPAWSYYSIVLGTLFNIICLACALYIRLKTQYQDSLKKSEILMELSKFHNSEMIINNIIHQWKLPLSRIISILTNLQAQIYFGKSIEKSVLEELPEINKNAILLAQIVQEFYKFNQSTEKTIFLFDEILDEIKRMLIIKIEDINANIELINEEKELLNTDRFAINNILSIIVNNFLDIAKIRNIKNPKLIISISKENNLNKILFEDNCGGNDLMPFEKIFEPFSSVSNDKSKGLGLYIAKTLVEEKLQGKIKGFNNIKGIVFEIVF